MSSEVHEAGLFRVGVIQNPGSSLGKFFARCRKDRMVWEPRSKRVWLTGHAKSELLQMSASRSRKDN